MNSLIETLSSPPWPYISLTVGLWMVLYFVWATIRDVDGTRGTILRVVFSIILFVLNMAIFMDAAIFHSFDGVFDNGHIRTQ